MKRPIAYLKDYLEDLDPLLLIALTILTVLITVLVACAGTESRAIKAWEAQCESMGGHVDSSTQTSTVVTYSADGEPSFDTTSHTTRYCLTEGGHILDIRG